MTSTTTTSPFALVPSIETAWQDVDSSFERFCLTAGIGAIEQMLCEDAQQLAGAPHSRGGGRVGHRWGRTKGKIGFHGGKVAVHRPRVRGLDGHELPLPTWTTAQAEDWLGRWAMNLMLINVSTRKLRRAVRLPNGDLPVIAGDGTSKSAASRRFVALSAERLAEWMASDLSQLDLLVIQIDGLHIGNDLVLVAALGIDGEGHKHPLGLVEGATENAAVVQALIDNLIERGLDPKVCRLFIIDGAKALSKVIRRTFGAHTPIQRCQIHKARNVIERLPKPLHASVRRALRQAWELDDADKAERLLRNLARRLDQEAPGVAASILEGLDCQSPPSPSKTPALARLHQLNRKYDGDRAPRLSQREAMAKCCDGAALDGRWNDGSGKGLPSLESLQAAPDPQGCACRSRCQAPRHQER
jgi:putative transposase